MSERIDLVPEAVAATVDRLDWPELHVLAGELCGRMRMVAEAPGAKVQPTQIAHGKPGASEPRAVPWCSCGHASLLDHHVADLEAAIERDLVRDGQDPLAYRDALVRAAEGVWTVTHRSARRPEDPAASDAGVERSERIISAYVGWTPERVASIETMRGGTISAEAVRRLRRRCEKHSETGEDGPPREELKEMALELHYSGKRLTQREIAQRVGVDQSTVSRWIGTAAEEMAS